MKLLKRIGKILTIFLLSIVVLGAVGYTYYLYASHQVFDKQPISELNNFTGEHINYPFKDGKFSIETRKLSVKSILSQENTAFKNGSNRQTILLNGKWLIAQGDLETIPESFNHRIQVPGFADMAKPAFYGVGEVEKNFMALGPKNFLSLPSFKDPKREAFWYKRSFTILGDVPANALLTLKRVKHGCSVWLNGILLGEKYTNYQQLKFDASKALKGNNEANELIVRVNTSICEDNKAYIHGDVIEKNRKLPGIYDDVILELTGSTLIRNIQVIPDIKNKRVRVLSWVRNTGQLPVIDSLNYSISPKDEGTTIANAQSGSFEIKAREERVFESTIELSNCKLWSPENPFLYAISVSSGNDTYSTTFGMREFHFNDTGVAQLNGEPYYLRGTSVPFFRFAEDPLRGDNPWNEQWVRELFRSFKHMNWNFIRFHIGQVPSMWYRIADEEGILIQDEYAIWTYVVWRQGVSLNDMVSEYVGWMEEQWNHPSVVIWDAQNESISEKEPRTGWALDMVRELDLSNRPWDNGWGERKASTDMEEMHPYLYEKAMFHPFGGDLEPLPDLSYWNKTPLDSVLVGKDDCPAIINEYAWLWINRDGEPTDLTKAGYDLYFPDMNKNDRREFYAYNVAKQTEYYRAIRPAGVMHFAGLNSNYTGSKTSDIFRTLNPLMIEPLFVKYVRPAFNPLGICLFEFRDDIKHTKGEEIPVVLVNDYSESWTGSVTFEISKAGKSVYSEQTTVTVEAKAKNSLKFLFPNAIGSGEYVIWASIVDEATGERIKSFRKVNFL